ncbi:hypothetical protein [Kribbella sp. NPDC051770]|uniref:hypothetical protein n=1 Tax=Kribbella sp. NPDC051770 TaxID=3155413 RepID=UPI00341258FE
MNTQLEPPRVPPLAPERRAQLRSRVLDQTERSATPQVRRWVAPAIAVAAVGAVVAGTLVISNQLGEADLQPATGPTVATPPKPTSKPTAALWLPRVDLGPVSAAEATQAANACKLPGAQQVDPLWARRVAIPGSAKTGVVVLTKSTPGQPGNTYSQGITSCFAAGAGASVRDATWKRQLSASRPAVVLSGMGSVGAAGDKKSAYASYESLLRVHPRIVRIESRYVWAEGQGQWTQGAVAGGFAYTHSTAVIPPGQYDPTPDGSSDLDQQFRAYDADGKLVPLNL